MAFVAYRGVTDDVVLGLFWLCLFILRGVGQDLGHFLSHHHRSCCILAGCFLGRLGNFEASVEDSIVYIVLLLLLPLPVPLPSSFSLAGRVCGAEADLLVSYRSRSRQQEHYRIVTGVSLGRMGGL